MAKQGRVDLVVGFKTDQSGLQNLKNQLQSLQNLGEADIVSAKSLKEATAQLETIKRQASAVEDALEKSFNPKLNTYNLKAFETEINKNAGGIKEIAASWAQAGAKGQVAINNLTTSLVTQNKHVKETSKLLDKMADTMANTVRWTIASSALNAMTSSVQKAFSFTQQLDRSLNDIMIVTEKSADDMANFARSANKAAKELGAVTTDYTKASLIYYQQGLSDKEVESRAQTTIKAANITRQSADAVSEQLTAIWNGYKVSAEESELYIDKVSAVAATTAADLEELATGMSRVASAANIMGVDIDQLNAQLATIVSVTREAPESIGTALKTVYARMSDIKAGLDDEISYDEYTKQLAEMGIQVVDSKNQMRDMGDVVEEIGEKWETFSRGQQVALAQIIAGTRQYSRMMSLFDNWDMYEQAKQTSENSAGVLQEQNEEYMRSMEAHMNKLQSQAEELYMTLFNAEDINPLIDGLTSVLGLMDDLVKGLGGGKGLIALLGTVGLTAFGDKMAMGMSRAAGNIKGMITDFSGRKAQSRILTEMKEGLKEQGLEGAAADEIIKLKERELEIERFMTDEDKKQFDQLIKKKAELSNEKIQLEEQAKITKQITENMNQAGYSDERQVADLVSAAKEHGTSDSWLDRAKQAANDASRQVQVDKINSAQQKINSKTAREKTKKEAAKTLESAEDQLARLGDFQYDSASLRQDLENAAKQSVQIRNNLNGTNIISEEDQKELAQLEDQAAAFLKKLDAGQTLSSKEYKEISNIFEKMAPHAGTFQKHMEAAAKDIKEGAAALDKINEDLPKVDGALDGVLHKFDGDELAKGFTSLAAGVSSAAMSFSMLSNIVETFGDESLETRDKVTQLLSSAGTLAFMLPNAFKQINDGLSKLNKGLGGSAKLNFWQIGGTVAALTAAVALFIHVLDEIEDFNNKEQKAFENAQKAAELATKRVQELNTAYQETASILEKINSLNDTLANLTEGTYEWRQAIAEVNDEVLALINKYPELAKYIERGKNGEMTITPAGQTYLENRQIEDMNTARFNSMRASQRANEAKVTASRDALADKYYGVDEELAAGASMASGALGGAAAGATIGSAMPILGTAIGALVGVLVGAIAAGVGTYAQEEREKEFSEDLVGDKNFEAAMRAYATHGEEIFKSETALAEALDTDVDSIKDLSEKLLANTDATIELAEAMKQQALEDYQNKVEQGKALGGETEGEQWYLGNEASRIDKLAEIEEKYKGGNEADRELAREYAELMGIEVKSIAAKGKNKVQINGEEYDVAVLMQALADEAVRKEAEQKKELWADNYQNIVKSVGGEDQATALMRVIGNDPTHNTFTNLTEKELAAFETLMEDHDWSQYGEEAEQYKNQYFKALKDTRTAWMSFMDEWSDKAQAAFNSIVNSLPDMTLGQRQTFANTYGGIYDVYGEESANQFAKIISDLGEDAGDVLDVIGGISWDQYQATDYFTVFSNALKDADIALAAETINSLVDGIQKANKDLSNNIIKLYSSNVVADQVRNTIRSGDAISDELYAKIQDYFPAIADNYITTNDKGQKVFAIPDGANVEEILQRGTKANITDVAFSGWNKYASRYQENRLATDKKREEYGEKLREYRLALKEVSPIEKEFNDLVDEYANSDKIVSTRARGWLGQHGINVDSKSAAKTYFKEHPELLKEYLEDKGYSEADNFTEIYNNLETAKKKYGDVTTLKEDVDSLGNELATLTASDNKLTEDEIKDFKQNILDVVRTTGTLEGISIEDWIEQNPQYEGMKSYFEAVWHEMFPDNSETEGAISEFKDLNYKELLSEEFGAIYTELTAFFGVNSAAAYENLKSIEDLTRAYEHQNEILEELQENYELLSKYDRFENLQRQAEAIKESYESLKAQQEYLGTLFRTPAASLLSEGRELFEKGTSDYSIVDILKKVNNGTVIDESEINKLQAWSSSVRANPENYSLEERNYAARILEFINSYGTIAKNIADNMDNAVREQLRNNLETLELEVTVTLDKNEIKRSYYDFAKEMLEEGDSSGLTAILDSTESTLLSDISAIMEGIEDVYNATVVESYEEGTEIMEGAISAEDRRARLEEYRNSLQNTMLELKKLEDEYMEMAIDAQDKLNELYEKQADYLEVAIALMESRFKLTKLITGEDKQNSKQLKEVAAGYYEIWEIQNKRFKEAEIQYKTLLNREKEAGHQLTDERSNQIRDLYFKMAQDASSTYNQMIEAYTAAYEREMTEIVENAFGIAESALAQLKEEQNWISQDAEHYLDTINKAYELDALRREFNKASREYSDPENQKRINALFEEEMKFLEEKDTLTEADFERSKKSLELLQARIALEEAQRNKTKMQLTRRADGTYGYEYVADQDKIEEAAQKVADLENELYNIDREAIKKNLDEIAKMYEDFAKSIVEAFTSGGIDEQEEKILQRALETLKKYIGDSDDLMKRWASSMGTTPEEMSTWSDAQFAAANISKGLYTLMTSLAEGNLETAFEAAKAQGVEGWKEFLKTIGVELDAQGNIVSSAGDAYVDAEKNAINESTNLNGAIQEQIESLDTLDEKLATIQTRYDELAKSILVVCAAMAGVSQFGDLDAAGSAFNAWIDGVKEKIPNIATAETGGYTGEWGSSGKFILAHEKELILNKTDTENILSAINIVRSLEDSLFSNLMSLDSRNLMSSAVWDLMKDWNMEQIVNIEANFPDATDRDEISEAFKDLINLATQHTFENTIR